MRGNCFLCNRYTELERHHIFGAGNRKRADRDGLYVDLCHYCHNEPPNGAHHNADTMLFLKQYGQRLAMQKFGWTIEDFIAAYGRNYL